ncbi:MAG: T9SS type A sorting domain-containing protein, partial [Flavobacteriales bacterium]
IEVITLHDNFGTVIYKKRISNKIQEHSINTNPFPSGIYHLHMMGKGVNYTRKIIIQSNH